MSSPYLLATVVPLLICQIGGAWEKNKPAPVSEAVVRLGTPRAEEVARALACEAYSFEYSGGPILCWLEVEERGQKTLPKDWGANLQKNFSPGGKGKLIFLIPASFHVSDMFHRFILSYQDDAKASCLPVEVSHSLKASRLHEANRRLSGANLTWVIRNEGHWQANFSNRFSNSQSVTSPLSSPLASS